MEVLLKHFYKHLYDLSEAYYCEQYSTACYESEIKRYFLLAKSLKDVLDEINIDYPKSYVGYCGYEIDLTDFEGW